MNPSVQTPVPSKNKIKMDQDRHFTKEDIQIANVYIKRRPTSQIRKCAN
jgi:hypothetical protein